MKIEKVNSMPNWLNDFVKYATKEKTTKTENVGRTVTAEINVKNLPTTCWKDETFYVQFTNGGAILFNEFGNEVIAIDNVTEMEEVNDYLNKNSVVANEDVDSKEVISEINDESQPVEDTEAKIVSEKEEENDQDDEFNHEIKKAAAYIKQAGEFDVDPEEQQIPPESENTSNPQQQVDQQDPTQSTNTEASIHELKREIDALKKQVTALSAQQYAYQVTPNDEYDLNCQDAEVQHFQESAANAQKVIDEEHKLDLSTQSGRAALNSDFLNDLMSVDSDFDDLDIKDNNDIVNDENEINLQQNQNDEVVVDEIQDQVENSEDSISDNLNQEIDNEINNELENNELNVVLLDDESDISSFENQTCPFCDNGKLTNQETVDNIVGIICDSCGKEYAVDTNNKNIYYDANA